MIEYKGYLGHIEYDEEADIFHGEVVNTRDVITFQGRNTKEIKAAFRDSIEDYLAFCALRNEQPDRPFSGKIALRTTPETHRKAYLCAVRAHLSLNKWIEQAITQKAH